jgi:predicted ATPase/class 3 adenylate cyclase
MLTDHVIREATATGLSALAGAGRIGAEATVTFLFTDIEGSTELWERHPSTMPAALARHDAVVRERIGAHGGVVFKALGDAFCAVFASAPDAVAAALDAQRSIVAEPWPFASPIKVRMAIHSGTAEQRGDDWFGSPLNRVARMLDAGHGGQILISQTVERLVADRFPEGVALVDLGERTLKDLARPERIFQLVTEDLPTDFPPLRSLDVRPHNLPVSPTPLVGREHEIAQLRTLFLRDRARLVTLVGPGGTGKTRLALQVAAELIDAFDDGVFLVDFAPVRNASLVPAEILQALGEKADDASPSDALRQALRDRHRLLVLDNFEQLVESAPLVGGLLREAPALALLVTSQAPLRVQGEREFPVAPLDVPAADTPADPVRLLQCDGVSLFVERAHAANPSFELTEENAAAVAEIVRQLDGLPLAIELAAARVKMFPPQALVGRLTRMFDFLTAGARDVPDRHRTLRGALQWSYDLLTEEEQELFQRQAVFDGGFTLDAAEAICSAPGFEIDVLGGIASLLDKSLLQQTRTSGAEPRFERLRTILAFAVEKLEESGEAALWRRRHAEWFAKFADRFNLIAGRGPDARGGIDRLSSEIENLRAAFGWAINNGESALAVRICGALPALWFLTGSMEEGQEWVKRVLALEEALSPHDRASALALRGRLAQVQGDNRPPVVADFEESLALFREVGDEGGIARSMMSLGNVHSRRGEHDIAEPLFLQSLEIYRRLGDRIGENGALLNLGDLALARRDIEQARARFEEAVSLARRSSNLVGLGFALGYVATLAYETDDYETAAARFQESLESFRAVGGGELSQGWMIAGLGSVARETGDLEKARAKFEEALDRFREHDYRPGTAYALVSLASVDALEHRPDRAARLLGASESHRGETVITRIPEEAVGIRIVTERSRAELGDDGFERARAAGAELTIDQAIALARSPV